MFTSRVRLLCLVGVLALIVVGAFGFWLVVPHAYAADGNDSKLKALLKERLVILQEVASQAAKAYQSGEVSFTQVLEAKQAAGHADLDLCDTDSERIAVLQKMLAQARDFENIVAEHVKTAESPGSAALKAKANRLEIEIALERVKGGKS